MMFLFRFTPMEWVLLDPCDKAEEPDIIEQVSKHWVLDHCDHERLVKNWLLLNHCNQEPDKIEQVSKLWVQLDP